MSEKYYNIAEVVAMDSLKRQAEHYGIEGLEDAIKRVYSGKTRDIILELYYKMYGVKNDG